MSPGQLYNLAIKLKIKTRSSPPYIFRALTLVTPGPVYIVRLSGCSYEIEERAYFHLISNKIQWHSFALNSNLLNALSALCRLIAWFCPFWY